MSESIVMTSRTLEDILWWLNKVERASGEAHAAIDDMTTPLTVEQKIKHDNLLGSLWGTADAAVRGIKNALLDADLMEDSPTLAEVNERRGYDAKRVEKDVMGMVLDMVRPPRGST